MANKGTAVRIPEDLLERLDQEAHNRVVSRNLLVINAIEFYLDRLPPVQAVGPLPPFIGSGLKSIDDLLTDDEKRELAEDLTKIAKLRRDAADAAASWPGGL